MIENNKEDIHLERSASDIVRVKWGKPIRRLADRSNVAYVTTYLLPTD